MRRFTRSPSSKPLLGYALFCAAAGSVFASACGDPFSSCEAHRSCAATGGSSGAGGDSEESAAGGTSGGRESGGASSGGSSTGGASIADGGSTAGASTGAGGGTGGSSTPLGGNGGKGAADEAGAGGESSGGASGSTPGGAGGEAGEGGTEVGGAGGAGGDGATAGGGAGAGGVDDPCHPNPCKNGGTCSSLGTALSCACPVRYAGARCEFLRFRGMGVLAGDVDSTARSVSGDGSTVVGTSMPADDTRSAVRSVNGGALQGLGKPAGTAETWCEARGVNADGSQIVGNCGLDVFQYTASAGATLVGTLQGNAQNLSADGTVIVGAVLPYQAFRRTAGGLTLLGWLGPNSESEAYAVSGDGSVIAGYNADGAGQRGWRWTEVSGMMELPKLNGWGTFSPAGVSRDGKVIVGWAYVGDKHAARWSGSQAVDLGPGSAAATSRDGSITVGDDGIENAALWVGTTMQTIASALGATPDLSGWKLRAALSVSDDGKVIVGDGMHAGHSEGWIAHLP